MNDINEKYLIRMLDGAKSGLQQVTDAIGAVHQQLEQMQQQKEEMEEAVAELSELLGESETEDAASTEA